MAQKVHYIASVHRDRTTIFAGTLEYLENHVFGYTLLCGNSWNNKIKRFPKTANALVNALNASADECRRYEDIYHIASKDEIAQYGYISENGYNC